MLDNILFVVLASFGLVELFETKLRISFENMVSSITFTKFFHNLSKCNFCIYHHISIIPTILIALSYFEWYMVLLPIISTTIINEVNSKRKGRG